MTAQRTALVCSVDGCEKPTRRGCGLECPMHYERRRSADTTKPCSIEGCEKPIQRRGICCMHAARFERSGTYELIPPKRRIGHTAGYVLVRAEGHVLARKNLVYEHRLVLFNRIGYGPHRCHWCDAHINWRSGLEADHLDRNRSNNADTNLVPSCHRCNTRRAVYQSKVKVA